MRTSKVVLVSLVLVLGAAEVLAQSFGTGRIGRRQTVPGQENEPILWGPFIISPGFQLSYDRHSNLFRLSEGAVSAATIVSRFRLDLELPIRESNVKVSYNPQYILSNDVDAFDNWEHYFDLSGKFLSSSGLTVDFNYSYLDGNSSVGEVDPGGELVFTGDSFTNQRLGATIGYWLTANDGVSIAANVASARWDRVDATGFDYDKMVYYVSWLHQASPSLVMDVRYQYEQNDPRFQQDWSRKLNLDSLTLGFRGDVGTFFRAGIRLGYLRSDSQGDSASGVENFEGFTVDGFISRALAHDSELRLDLTRRPFVSARTTTYFVGTGARLLYNWTPGRFFAQARVGYQVNTYQSAAGSYTSAQEDKMTTYGAGIGYRITTYMALRTSYIYEDRDSRDALSFDRNVLSVDLVVGF